MALQAQQLPSFPFASPVLRTLRLPCTLKSSTKCFLRSRSQFRTPQQRRHPGRRFLDSQEGSGDDEGEEADEIWGPPDTLYRARLHGAWEDKEGGRWGPPRLHEAEQEERLQESEVEDGGEVGEWDPPVSPFRGQHGGPYHQEEQEEEGDEDGERPEWLDPSFFLRCQEGVSGPCRTTTAAMEEILVFAWSPSVDGPEFAEFLAGYSSGDLSEGDCVDLMMRMAEEGLTLGCVHLFQWTREQERLLVLPRALLVAIAALGRTVMADEVLEIVLNLPSEREFHEVVLYNVAISAVAYCRR
jgi:hypothetical protein